MGEMMWFTHAPSWDWVEPGAVFTTEEAAQEWCDAVNAKYKAGYVVFGDIQVNPKPPVEKAF